VVRGDGAPGAAFGADHHGHGGLAAEHVAVLGALVGDLVHGQRGEVDVHDLGDGAHAGHRRAHRRAADGRLGDGRIEHAPVAELFDRPRVAP
jgi:hypothetical protein